MNRALLSTALAILVLFAGFLTCWAAEETAFHEEYVGPMPAKIPRGVLLESIVNVNDDTGRVAYYYRFDAPEEFLKGDVTLASGNPASQKKARVILDGIPTAPYYQVTQPLIGTKSCEFIAEYHGAFRVIRDGKPGENEFQSIFLHGNTPKFDRNVYVVSMEPYAEGKQRLRRVLLDGEFGPEFDKVQDPEFSASGRVFYFGQKDAKWHCVIDGKVTGVHEAAVKLTFSPDGQRYAYYAVKGDLIHVVLDGEKQTGYARLGKNGTYFSPDSKRFAYAAKIKDGWCFVVDGKEQTAHEDIEETSFEFSPDSKHFGYFAKKGKKWTVVVDGQEGSLYDEVRKDENLFSPSGKPYYIATNAGDDKQAVVYPGQKDVKWFYRVSWLRHSSDGKQTAYIAFEEQPDGGYSAMVIHNGKAGPKRDGAADLEFSPDGKSLAFVARREDEKLIVVVDGNELPSTFDKLEHLVWSPDGTRLAIRGQRNKDVKGKVQEDIVLVDGEEHGAYRRDSVFDAQFDQRVFIGELEAFHPRLQGKSATTRPVFSPDGKHLAYLAFGKNGWVFVLDGKESRPYERVLHKEIVFETPTRARCFGMRDEGLFRIRTDLDGKLAKQDAQSSEQAFNDGLRIEKEDNVIAAGYYRKAAEVGHRAAQNNLGVRYSETLDGWRDYETMLYWWRKSADQGNMVAFYNLGRAYEHGWGVKKDPSEAHRWYLKSAEMGHAWAQNVVGFNLYAARGVRKNDAEALKWYLKAAEQGHADAQYNAGWHYDEGVGTQTDYQEAMKWYRKAAKQEQRSAINNIGWLYERGDGVRRNIVVAKQWYRKAARMGDAKARENLQGFLPDQQFSRGMYPWFNERRSVGAAYASKGGETVLYQALGLEFHVPDRDQPISVTLPLYVYSDEEANAAKGDDGRYQTRKLPAKTIDDFRSVSDQQRRRLQRVLPAHTIPICYPPYVVLADPDADNLKGPDSQTKKMIQELIEDSYETAASY